MPTSRREFLEHLTATAMLGAVPLSAMPSGAELLTVPSASLEEWDLSWTARLKGKTQKACFDCAEPESGFGIWRASMWEAQYHAVLGAKPSDTATVLVLRHDAIVLALKQETWAKYTIGADAKITHPLTQQGTERNPALLGTADGLPANFAALTLPSFMARGGIVLACAVALQFWSGNIAKKDNVSAEEALKRAKDGIIPGILLQPSGVFAAVKAQHEGCAYVHAS